MPYVSYTPRKFAASTQAVIDRADQILKQYAAQGYTMTLRQVFYQFVARGWLPNKDTEYKRLGSIINDARLAGDLNWDHMEDRTRNLRVLNSWDSPAAIINAVAAQFQEDLWKDQPAHVEVWIEKDALVGTIERPCNRNSIGFFSCRGYTSQSEIWAAAQRLGEAWESKGGSDGRDENGELPRIVIVHLGDHDPSGIDMTRDIRTRLQMFLEHDYGFECAESLDVRRVALNMPQVQQYSPPPNPAKLTDSRAEGYIARFGDESWELDALAPPVIDQLIQDEIDDVRDQDLWDAAIANRDRQRGVLKNIATRWIDVEQNYG